MAIQDVGKKLLFNEKEFQIDLSSEIQRQRFDLICEVLDLSDKISMEIRSLVLYRSYFDIKKRIERVEHAEMLKEYLIKIKILEANMLEMKKEMDDYIILNSYYKYALKRLKFEKESLKEWINILKK